MKTLRLVCIIFLIAGMVSPVFSAVARRTAAIAQVNGTVEVKIGSADWVPAKTGLILNQGDIVRTKENSWALLNVDGMAETATVELKKNSRILLTELLENKEDMTQKTLLDLTIGEILIKAKKLHSGKSSFEVKTPTSIVGVRGTTFSVTVEAVE